MTSIRTKGQLQMLLKFLDVNQTNLHRNASVRQKIWRVIAEKLNAMPGAIKDVDGWKRSYATWRSSLGENAQKETHKLLQDVPGEKRFYISITEDEEESDTCYEDEEYYVENPTDAQLIILDALVRKHREILQSAADDEPLKARYWLNITERLNSIPNGIKLKPSEWKKRVDWSKHAVRRGRKATKRAAPEETPQIVKYFHFTNASREGEGESRVSEIQRIDWSKHAVRRGRKATKRAAPEEAPQNVKYFHLTNASREGESRVSEIQYDVIDDNDEPQDADSVDEDYQDLSVDKTAHAQPMKNYDERYSHQTEQDDDPDSPKQTLEDFNYLLNSADRNAEGDIVNSDNEDNTDYVSIDYINEDDETDEERSLPIAKSFKFSKRVVHSVESIARDVTKLKESLEKNNNKLSNLEKLMQQQCEQQEETNKLLKRNGQLLKILAHYKKEERANANNN